LAITFQPIRVKQSPIKLKARIRLEIEIEIGLEFNQSGPISPTSVKLTDG